MALRFYNTLTQELEEFRPLDGKTVRMYTCGPTVYHYVHIGNFRTFSFQDVLRRVLRARGFALDHVMNITDVEDKIIRNAMERGQTLKEYTSVYTQAFLDDAAVLRLERPERFVFATDHITEMVEAIQGLAAKQHTYESDGSTYFRIATFPGYGKLSHTNFSGNIAGAAWKWTSMRRTMHGTSCSGSRRSRANRHGTARSGRGVLAGTSSAR